MKSVSNKDVPIRAVLKYIKEDRDKYKAKLEQLIPYTKSLEAQCAELKKSFDAEVARRVQSLEARLENARNENRRLVEERTAMIHDLHNSQWYKDMQKSHAQRAEELRKLKIAYNRVLVELTQLKNDTNR